MVSVLIREHIQKLETMPWATSTFRLDRFEEGLLGAAGTNPGMEK
jgi:hypothetical protein